MSDPVNQKKMGDNYRSIIAFLEQDRIDTLKEIGDHKMMLAKMGFGSRLFRRRKRGTSKDQIFALQNEVHRVEDQIFDYKALLDRCIADKRCL